MRVFSLSSLRVLLSLVLAAHPAFAAGTRGGSPSKFAAAHTAALADAAKAFVAADAVDADAVLAPLAPLTETDADKAALEKFRAQLKEMAELRTPVAAKAGPQPADEESDILDSKYKGRVLALAVKVGADGQKAVEARRALLRKTPPLGPDGKPLAGAAAQPPTPAELAAIRRMEARKRLDKARTINAANRVNAALGTLNGPESLPAGAGAVDGPTGSARQAAKLIGVANSAFKGGPSTLKTNAVHAPGGEAPPTEKGWWTKFRDATTWDGAQKAFEGHNKKHMAAATALEDRSAASFAKGDYFDGAWDATAAWGRRLYAGDSKAVLQAAVGAGVVVAAVMAAPIVLPGAAAAAVVAKAGGAAALGVKAVFTGVTTLSIINGTGHLAHKPDVVNAGLLALSVATVPYLGEASKGIVNVATGLRGSAVAVETTGAVALGAAVPETTAVVAAAGSTAVKATTSTAAATGGAVEAAAAAETAVVQIAKAGSNLKHVAVEAVEKTSHNALHFGAEKVTAVDAHH